MDSMFFEYIHPIDAKIKEIIMNNDFAMSEILYYACNYYCFGFMTPKVSSLW